MSENFEKKANPSPDTNEVLGRELQEMARVEQAREPGEPENEHFVTEGELKEADEAEKTEDGHIDISELENMVREDEKNKPETVAPDWSKLDLDIDFNKLDEAAHQESDTSSTPAESRSKLRGLVEKITEMTGSAREMIGEGFEKSKTFLVERGKELGAGLRGLSAGIAEDLEAAGKSLAQAATHPIETARAIGSSAERAANYAKYFADRNVSLAEKGEKLKVDLKELTENYNKLPFRKKAYITAALIGGSSVAAAASLPTLSAVLASGMYGVRALGGAGFALNRRKGMEARIAKDPEHWLADKSDRFKNTYAAALGAAYSGGTAIAGHYAMEKLSDWLGHVFGHTTVEAPTHTHGNIVRAPAAAPAGEAVAAAHVLPEMPSVDASAGHGYEYMAKRLWEQLHAKSIDPSQYPEGSDIHRLLAADAHSIDKVVHQIAADPHHGFFKPDGTSAAIAPNAHMTIDATGQIHMSDHINGIKVPEGAPVTPAYVHPEAPVAAHEVPPIVHEVATPPVEQPHTPDLTHTPDLPPHGAETAASPIHPVETSPDHLPPMDAPVPAHEIITNHFGLNIPLGEAHIYTGIGRHELFVYGGSSEAQMKLIQDYLNAHPKSLVFGTDTGGRYRFPYYLENGQVTAGPQTHPGGLLKVFATPEKAPGPEDLEALIQ